MNRYKITTKSGKDFTVETSNNPSFWKDIEGGIIFGFGGNYDPDFFIRAEDLESCAITKRNCYKTEGAI